MSRATTAVLIALVVLLVITSLSMFTVDQRQNAIVFRLGEPVQRRLVFLQSRVGMGIWDERPPHLALLYRAGVAGRAHVYADER